MLALLSGLSAGALHVVSGPDHLVAMGPLSLERPDRGALLGASWGAGHGGGVIVLALLALLLRSRFDFLAVSAQAELLVGFLLIAMGIWGFRHRHGHRSPRAHYPRAAFAVGLLHGTAGAGHLLGVLPTLGLEQSRAVGYLVAYLLAAIATMSAVGWLFGAAAGRLTGRHLEAVRRVCSGLAVTVGVAWIAQAA